MEDSVLLGTKPLVDSIRHFIRDPSGVFSVCHLCECRIVPPFAFVELVSPYNKKNITRWLEGLNFMFSWQEQYFTSERSERVRYCEHKIRIFSPSCNILYIFLSLFLWLGINSAQLKSLRKWLSKHFSRYRESSFGICL